MKRGTPLKDSTSSAVIRYFIFNVRHQIFKTIFEDNAKANANCCIKLFSSAQEDFYYWISRRYQTSCSNLEINLCDAKSYSPLQ